MSIKYRPEIDGLRAIAVIAVIIYHLKIDKFFSGGFLGVDVFFVISGFLITSIIVKEIKETGRFRFLRFYERRVRRLIPVLLVVIFVTTIAAWFILLPTQLISYGKSIVSSLFFYSNFHWHFSLQEYEAESSLLQPLLHTWTLSLEEQFYFIFPIILIAITSKSKRLISTVLILITLTSFILGCICSIKFPSFSFYLIPTRFWELSFGALLAILSVYFPNKLPPNKIRPWLALCGFAAILFSFIFVTHDHNHPGFITLLPLIGTTLIIYTSSPDNVVTQMLSNKPFVKIGLWSYSLYLWHYPVFALARNVKFENTFIDYFLWIFTTFLLSIITYYFIEQPFRRKQIVSNRVFYPVVITGVFLLLMAVVLINENNGFPDRFQSLQAAYENNEIDNRILRAKRNEVYTKHIKSFDISEKENNERRVLILGDSHSKDVYLAMKLNEDKFVGYTFDRMFIGGLTESQVDKNLKNLLDTDNVRLADIIVIAMRFSSKQNLWFGIERTIKRLKKEGKIVMLTSNNAEFEKFGRYEAFDKFIIDNAKQNGKIIPEQLNAFFYENLKSYIRTNNEKLKSISNKYNIKYLDRYALICDDVTQKCQGITPGGKKSYVDTNHWSLEGCSYFGSRMHEFGWLDSNMKPLKPKLNSIGSSKGTQRSDISDLKKELQKVNSLLRIEKDPTTRKELKLEKKEINRQLRKLKNKRK